MRHFVLAFLFCSLCGVVFGQLQYPDYQDQNNTFLLQFEAMALGDNMDGNGTTQFNSGLGHSAEPDNLEGNLVDAADNLMGCIFAYKSCHNYKNGLPFLRLFIKIADNILDRRDTSGVWPCSLYGCKASGNTPDPIPFVLHTASLTEPLFLFANLVLNEQPWLRSEMSDPHPSDQIPPIGQSVLESKSFETVSMVMLQEAYKTISFHLDNPDEVIHWNYASKPYTKIQYTRDFGVVIDGICQEHYILKGTPLPLNMQSAFGSCLLAFYQASRGNTSINPYNNKTYTQCGDELLDILRGIGNNLRLNYENSNRQDTEGPLLSEYFDGFPINTFPSPSLSLDNHTQIPIGVPPFYLLNYYEDVSHGGLTADFPLKLYTAEIQTDAGSSKLIFDQELITRLAKVPKRFFTDTLHFFHPFIDGSGSYVYDVNDDCHERSSLLSSKVNGESYNARMIYYLPYSTVDADIFRLFEESFFAKVNTLEINSSSDLIWATGMLAYYHSANNQFFEYRGNAGSEWNSCTTGDLNSDGTDEIIATRNMDNQLVVFGMNPTTFPMEEPSFTASIACDRNTLVASGETDPNHPGIEISTLQKDSRLIRRLSLSSENTLEYFGELPLNVDHQRWIDFKIGDVFGDAQNEYVLISARDLFVFNSHGNLLYRSNNGPQSMNTALALGNFDGDDKLEIAYSRDFDNEIVLLDPIEYNHSLKSIGSTNYSAENPSTLKWNSLTCADLDFDGLCELVATNTSDHDIYFYKFVSQNSELDSYDRDFFPSINKNTILCSGHLIANSISPDSGYCTPNQLVTFNNGDGWLKCYSPIQAWPGSACDDLALTTLTVFSNDSCQYSFTPQITIAPNPTQGWLVLDLEDFFKTGAESAFLSIELYSVTGAKIWQLRSQMQNVLHLDFSLVPAGVYVMNIQFKDGDEIRTECKKVVLLGTP